MSLINQKDYLKKYLKIGKQAGEKKKKKQSKKRLKIIDDDVCTTLSQEIQVDIDAANEDAPQIVAVIDDRPPSMRIDEKTKSNLWQPIGESNETSSDFKSFKMGSIRLHKHEEQTISSKSYSSKNELKDLPSLVNESKNIDDSFPRNRGDYSPNRNKKFPTREDYSPPRKIVNIDSRLKKGKSADFSPARLKDKLSPSRDNALSPSRRKDKDYSPPRRKDKYFSPPKRNDNYSLPRGKDKDHSPPRRNDKDHSPPRRNDKDYSPPNTNDDYSPPRRKDKDYSPPRRKDKDYSPPRRNEKYYSSPIRNDKDYSPSSRKDKNYSCSTRKEKDHSPTRKKDSLLRKQIYSRDDDHSPPRKTITSPSGKNSELGRNHDSRRKASRWEKDDFLFKPEGTLSGKKSGLQNAQNLVEDITRLQKQEEEIFRTMSADVSGVNASTIVRRKKQEKVVDPEKVARDTELKEKYSVWGKGLKQVQDETTKFEDQLKEMNKPMARYADDEDLEKYLKEQEREGDPMLAYIRKKKKKVAIEQGVSEKPIYMGDFMPNRYGIRPGYRWDGVDRSSGYETKWFQTQNSKKALQDEALMWSTEDM